MMNSAMTHAKMGRSMKNWAMARAPQRAAPEAADAARVRTRARLRRWPPRCRRGRLLPGACHGTGFTGARRAASGSRRPSPARRPSGRRARPIGRLAGRRPSPARGLTLPSAPTTSTVSPCGRARHRLLRQHDARRRLAPAPAARARTGRAAAALGVGHLGAQRDLAGGGVHRQVGEQQLARLRVVRCRLPARTRTLAASLPARLNWPLSIARRKRSTSLAGLGEVHVHRVDLLDHRQRRGLALADQRAFGDQRAADAARRSAR